MKSPGEMDGLVRESTILIIMITIISINIRWGVWPERVQWDGTEDLSTISGLLFCSPRCSIPHPEIQSIPLIAPRSCIHTTITKKISPRKSHSGLFLQCQCNWTQFTQLILSYVWQDVHMCPCISMIPQKPPFWDEKGSRRSRPCGRQCPEGTRSWTAWICSL